MSRIDLNNVVGDDVRVLIGQDRGVAVRNSFNLDALDQNAEDVEVVVPPTLRTLTPSFVQGLFATSIHSLGESGFFRHYKFHAPAHVLSDIRAGVDRVLTSRHLAGVDPVPTSRRFVGVD
jgi:hypothetical protein